MSTYTKYFTLRRQISKLNRVIDTKIIAGLDYKEDARRHKKLLAEIRKTKQARPVWSWGMASLKYVSMFLF